MAVMRTSHRLRNHSVTRRNQRPLAPPVQFASSMQTISLDALTSVTGGATSAQSWEQIRSAAAPHCPNTVAAHPTAPHTRAQAQSIGNACVAEMGSFKAAMGGRDRIQAGIDAAFPR